MKNRFLFNIRGQVVIWTIVAVAVVALIILIFVFSIKPEGGTIETDYNPQGFMRQCVGSEVNKIAEIVLERGGFVNPSAYIVYNNKTIEYICKNEGLFKSCINQHPNYIHEISNEMNEEVKEKIEDCFIELEENLKSKDIEVDMKEMTSSVSLAPRKIIVDINREVNIKEKESSQFIDNWKIEVNNPLYDLASVAVEIASQEAVYCYFEYVGYMNLHPEVIIKKIALGDSSKIYTIKDFKSEKELNIAIRGCVIPPGM